MTSEEYLSYYTRMVNLNAHRCPGRQPFDNNLRKQRKSCSSKKSKSSLLLELMDRAKQS